MRGQRSLPNCEERGVRTKTGFKRSYCETINVHRRRFAFADFRIPCNRMVQHSLKRVDASAVSTMANLGQTSQSQVAESSFGLDSVWYFAYGSNMNPKTLTGRRQVVPLESRPAVLRGWKLSFRMLGLPYIEPGFATIERVDGGSTAPPLASSATASTSPATAASPPFSNSSSYNYSNYKNDSSERWGSELHGVLHRVSIADWVQIMATEGVGAGKSGYRVVEVEVTQYNGRRVRALTLEGQPPSLHNPGRSIPPSRRYLGLLRDGARHHGLDPEYITYLDSLQSYEANGWNNAMGRAVVLAAAVPLALPLLPPVLLLRMARNSKAREAKQQVEVDGDRGVGVGAAATAADCSTVEECAEAVSKGAAVAAKDPVDVLGGGAAKTAAVQPSVSSSTSISCMTATAASRGSVTAAADSDCIPPQLLRPPMVLPEVVSGYLRAVQYATWAVHDVLAATVLGSDSRAVDAKQQQQR